ncbi:D-lyxose/D-mannose family sugar isomerase [Paenibacillus agricola]|uniref:D-lyxose/D-mannose family sugar isomerase n=1 Tax=Paenibacillus agricola TaxID=2716264 RepID=A0ABX0JC37_9BACL|nr:D-lyxose/D-mannose family sugar isomerase [Paenibacillus agricola]NHN33722.1 D-lyxose/D-mannose family sugar isomerase [Paenibacillus agricola]
MVISSEVARMQALALLNKAHISLSEADIASLKVIDFGLKDIAHYGVQFVEYMNNERYCARQLVLLPRQTIPEHKHPPVGDDPGKVETFRVVWGKVWAYIEGDSKTNMAAKLMDSSIYFTAFHEIELNVSEQCTIGDNQFHWFQAGDEGAVVIEFSSPARDRFDIFKDPRVQK